MQCKICQQNFMENEMKGKSKLYCSKCHDEKYNYVKSRKEILENLKSLPLEIKVMKSLRLISSAITEFGEDAVYVSYSGGKDSTVLSHLARINYPNVLHLFANTTCEYPETMQHLKWEREQNNMNLVVCRPKDRNGLSWNFKRVVDSHGFPLFSKVVANSIRTYRRAKTEQTKQNSIDYISRRFKKYSHFKDKNISDLCCEKLKKQPLKQTATKLGLECALIGTLAEESRQRENDWINYGCNVFNVKKDNQCRPLSFWTEADIHEYIRINNIKISELYSMGYSRNGCMFCGFGIEYDIINGKNRYERLAETHPISYNYLINNFKDILDECHIKY